MYKLFAAAQAIEFSLGCHAKCSNFVVKSKEFPLASTPGASAPVQQYQILELMIYTMFSINRQIFMESLLKNPTRANEIEN